MKKQVAVLIQLMAIFLLAAAMEAAAGQMPSVDVKVLEISAVGQVKVSFAGSQTTVREGQRAGKWTLMAVVPAGPRRESRYAVLEDFHEMRGSLLFMDASGAQVVLPKSLEPTFAQQSGLYLGRKLDEVMNSGRDLLGEAILAAPSDPSFDEIAACFPPISKMKTYTFVGVRDNLDKVGFNYGGRTSHFDAAAYLPQINRVRDHGRVWDGLVGGWLPVVRFVYPEESGNWSELIAYAPMRMENHNNQIQPVWYRVSRIEDGELKWVHYFDSYHPFPPRGESPAAPFYEELLAMRAGWNKALEEAMTIEIPDQRLANMARHSLVRGMITRMGVEPRYGVFDKDYGGNEHAGFPDTFNTDTLALQEWGILSLAGRYIDNYFGKYVRDDGSILYRGPETGQYGRMLTVTAEYANYSGNDQLLLRLRRRIDSVTRLLLALREKALRLSPADPSYGMIAGWSEADACLDPEPSRYMQPYFSNSTEAARGFRDLGLVWERIARKAVQPELAAWGRRLVRESEALNGDIQKAISRSILKDQDPVCLPAIAGVTLPFHSAVARDPLDPQFRSYRAYMEMLYSGNLTRDQVEMVVKYRAGHRDTILGIPTAYGYNTHELAGFLSYGHGYGLIQHDYIREYLLTLYSIMAHQYTRGTWTAPETRNIDPDRSATPYCVPAQMVVPMMTRWMLVFEDPYSNTMWLAKATPRSWLEDGKRIAVTGAPTRWGRIGFSARSFLRSLRIEVEVDLPAEPFDASVKVRLRVPERRQIRSVTVNNRPWKQFDPQEETITLPYKSSGKSSLAVSYQ
jgi:hypothetical protein